MNKLQWISIDESVIIEAEGMASNAHISDEDIAQVLQGNSLADMSRLVFRDPGHFRAGELHRHAPHWNTLLDDMNDVRFSEIRDWITNGVDVTKFLDRLRVVTKERITSVAVHHLVFSLITFHANLLPRLYLMCSWTVYVPVLFLCGAKSENAPHPTSSCPSR